MSTWRKNPFSIYPMHIYCIINTERLSKYWSTNKAWRRHEHDKETTQETVLTLMLTPVTQDMLRDSKWKRTSLECGREGDTFCSFKCYYHYNGHLNIQLLNTDIYTNKLACACKVAVTKVYRMDLILKVISLGRFNFQFHFHFKIKNSHSPLKKKKHFFLCVHSIKSWVLLSMLNPFPSIFY